MNFRWCFCLLICCLVDQVKTQILVQGGLQGSREIVLAPDTAFNRRVQGLTSADIRELGLHAKGSEVTMIPELPSHWTWIVGLNVRIGARSANLFMDNGRLYTTESLKTTWRLMRYQKDVTDQVFSNAVHVAFYRSRGVEREIVLFVVSPRRQMVKLRIPAEFAGKERTLEFPMEDNASKFLRVSLLPEEYTTVTWAKERSPRRVVDLGKGWKFWKGDATGAERPEFPVVGWEDVTIPHTWNALDIYDMRNVKDDVEISTMYYRGPGWYRNTFFVDTTVAGSSCMVEFLGANQVAGVWLNGVRLGVHTGGYTGFSLDAGPGLRPGAVNVLAVRVDNAYNATIPPLTADFNFYGGLYREVRLVIRSPMHIRDVVWTTPEVDRSAARVRVKVKTAGASDDSLTVVCSIVNPYGELAATMLADLRPAEGGGNLMGECETTIRRPLLWSPEHPYLYQVLTEVRNHRGQLLDQEATPLGFRWCSFDSDRGFSLNGEPLKLRGVNLHQDFLNKGNAVPLEQKREDILFVKNMGANFVRLAHYPHHPYVLHLCDSLGLLVWEEIPLVNSTGGDALARNAMSMLEEMIVRDRNHPSVILWGLGNEFSMKFQPKETLDGQKRLLRGLHERAHALDPLRVTVQAHNDIADTTLFNITDIQGRNRYYGWYEGTIADFAKALDEEKKRYPRWKTLISEYGAEAKYGFHVARPVEFDHSETYQMAFHEAYWRAIEERPWVAGGTIWTMFDFGSYVKLGNIPGINQKGMMTADRKPKSVYYFYQSKWTKEPMVYIVSHTWTHRTGKRNEIHGIKVYSNCDSVSLYHNGTFAGTRKGPSAFEWPLRLTEGEHRLEAYGRRRGVIVRDAMSFVYIEECPL